ncbi:hypothetical protein Tco_1129589, partial [Tanacetum coccineum]
YIRSGVDSGATLETGGERFGSKGYYIQHTVFSNVQGFLWRITIPEQCNKYHLSPGARDLIPRILVANNYS